MTEHLEQTCGICKTPNSVPGHYSIRVCAECAKRYEEAKDKWDKPLEPEITANEKSSRITAEDLAVTINARDTD